MDYNSKPMNQPQKGHNRILSRILWWSTGATFVVGILLPRGSGIQMCCMLLWVALASLCLLLGAIGVKNLR